MDEAIDGPDEMSPYAPRVTTVRIPVDKIGAVIGPKGQMINAIQDETGADITIEDDGTIYVGASDGPSAQAAVDRINAIANPQMPKVGERFLGTVVKTTPFGAFVSLLPGQGRPGPHQQAGWRQADRQGRGRRQRRRQAAGRDPGDRRTRQDQPRPVAAEGDGSGDSAPAADAETAAPAEA
jgi:polyribonucleotide nucleotidyltransferase